MTVTDCIVEEGAVITHPELVNLYGCRIRSETRIGPFVEIQRGSAIGARCKISSHSFICAGVTIEDEVFVGHGVMFTNDLFPRATNDAGEVAGGGRLDMPADGGQAPRLNRLERYNCLRYDDWSARARRSRVSSDA